MSKCNRKSISTLAMLAAMAALFPIAASAAPAETLPANQDTRIPIIIFHSPLDDLAANASHGAFGSHLKRTYVQAVEFHSDDSGSGLSYWGGGYYYLPYARQAATGLWFHAPVSLPDGALLCYLGMYAYDNHTLASRLMAQIMRYTGGFQTIGSIPLMGASSFYDDTVVSTGTYLELAAVDVGGAGLLGFPNCTTINNDVLHGGSQYAIELTMPSLPSAASDYTVALKAVELGWYRQISPAPVSATFSDVPTNHTFFQAVEALSEAGITTGCGGANFCPGQTVNRGQMAAFLARALGL